MEVVIERIGAAFGIEAEDLRTRQAAAAIITGVVDHIFIATVGSVLGGKGNDLAPVKDRLAVCKAQVE
jgi:hypothetical protein